jgi:outer membrane protein TolC
MKIIICLSVFLIFFSVSKAQQTLTPEEAVNIALKNNYDILVSRNDANIDSVNNTAGNAGMLPNIAITGSDNYSPASNVDQQPSSGSLITSSNARSNTLNAGINLNWTLFDGGKMFVTKNKLNQIQALGELQFKDQVLQTVYSVVLAYYDVVRQKQQLASINKVISYNLDRVKITQTMFDAGLSAKPNLLQAKIDLNVFQENVINQQAVIVAAKRILNQLLSRGVDTPFEVADSIMLNYAPDKKMLAQKLDSANTTIRSFQKQVDIANLTVKEMNTLRLPRFNFNAGYDLSQSNTSVGSILMTRTYGPVVGGSLTIPIYQAGNVNRQVKTAKIQYQSAQHELENMKLLVSEQLQNAITQFENQQQLLTIEKDNAILAKENLDIIIQRLRLGQTTSLEVTQAEANFVESLTRLVNFEYNLKVAETKLKQLLAQL